MKKSVDYSVADILTCDLNKGHAQPVALLNHLLYPAVEFLVEVVSQLKEHCSTEKYK